MRSEVCQRSTSPSSRTIEITRVDDVRLVRESRARLGPMHCDHLASSALPAEEGHPGLTGLVDTFLAAWCSCDHMSTRTFSQHGHDWANWRARLPMSNAVSGKVRVHAATSWLMATQDSETATTGTWTECRAARDGSGTVYLIGRPPGGRAMRDNAPMVQQVRRPFQFSSRKG